MVALQAIQSDKAVNKRPRIVGQHRIATAAFGEKLKRSLPWHGLARKREFYNELCAKKRI